MKLTAKVKLLPTEQQRTLLYATLTTVNCGCDWASAIAFEYGVFKQFDLHHLAYTTLKEDFHLSAQLAVRTIAKVAYAYKVGKKDTAYTFHPHGAIAYDDRILTWNTRYKEVSIWCMGGRQKIDFVCDDRTYQLLQSRSGESDLAFVDGNFYLFAACDIDIPAPIDVSDFLGVDLGIVNIATDSDGNQYSGKQVNALRYRHRRLRQKLQAKGTRSARRKLRQRRRKESRFAKDVNHCISKQLCPEGALRAKDTHRGIALEELGGIRDRQTVRKAQRSTFTGWSFNDLRQKVTYKTLLAGIPITFVDPRNTSRTCPSCGCIDKRNRKTQSQFKCVECGYCANADINAARNISCRAVVNLPNAPL